MHFVSPNATNVSPKLSSFKAKKHATSDKLFWNKPKVWSDKWTLQYNLRQVRSPGHTASQNQFISGQIGTAVNVQLHCIDNPPTRIDYYYGHARGKVGIKRWVREDIECVGEMKEINITSAGCWAGQLVDNECVLLQSGNGRLLLTPASTVPPAHLIILQSKRTQNTACAHIQPKE